MENADVILNVVIAGLLVITIIFCLVLSRKIASFNSNKTDLAKFLLEFNDSIKRAENNINQLKDMGTNVDENLKAQIKRARFLANDLSFLSEKGETVAQNLESKISMSRDTHRKISSESSVAPGRREIISGDSPFRPKQPSAPPAGEKSLISPSKRQALDALLQEIAKKKSETL